MPLETWAAMDRYITDLLVRPDPVLEEVLRSSKAAGLPTIAVSAPQGAMLQVLVRLSRARRILEVGTLGGFSAIWMARGLPPDGKLVSLELEPLHARVAQENFRRAGLERLVEVRVGPALESLRVLRESGAEPFDLVFIDADKANNAAYFDWALELSRPGALIVVDNVVRNGAVLDARTLDASAQGVRRLNERMAAEPGLLVTEVQTVGEKGYDGFALALVPPSKGRGAPLR